jgi:membrane-bound lytic murein transglycosylase
MLKSTKLSRKQGRQSGAGDAGTAACALTLLILALVAVAGCGSGGAGSSSSEAAGSAAGTKSFPKDAQSKQYVAFGEEAASAEREAASAVLSENLKARQAADFGGQCSSLGKAGLETVVGNIAANEIKQAKAKCPVSLKSLAEPLVSTKAARTNTLSGPIAALRVKGSQGYALYHGNDGKNYAVPMEKEGGKWLVGSIVTTEFS